MTVSLRGRETARDLRGCLLVVGGLGVLPVFLQQPYWLGIVMVGMYYGILAQAWNLLAGYTGQFSLAPAAFAMIGAYTPGLLYPCLPVPRAIGILAGTMAAGIVGLLLGRLLLRLKGPYFVLGTLAFSEITRLFVSNSYELTRGDLGLSIPGLMLERVPFYYVFLAALCIVLLVIYALMSSRAGLYLKAIRDDDVAASARGVRVVFWKTAASGLSAALCGFGGALYVHFNRLASPEMGTVLETGLVVGMVVIGGKGSFTGPLLGAFLLQMTSELFREAGVSHMLIFSLLIILAARFFRNGLWGIWTGRTAGRKTAGAAGRQIPGGHVPTRRDTGRILADEQQR